MRKSVSVVLFLCLLLAASFGSAREMQWYSVGEVREQTAQGWHETYKAHGREIVVDIDVFTPDKDTLPVWFVELARMTPAFTEAETGWEIYCDPEYNSFVYSKKATSVPEDVDQGGDAVYSPPFDMNKAYATGNDLTLGEALEIIQDSFATAGLDADEYLFERPFLLTTFAFYKPKTKEVAYPGQYYLHIYHMIDGVPILCHAGEAFREKARGYYTKMAALAVSPDDFEVFLNSVTPTKKIVDDIPLCSYKVIQEAIEEEINNGHIRQIFDLELGYALYNDPECVKGYGPKQSYYAVPVWHLNCLYLTNAKKELPEYSSETTFSRDSNEFAQIIFNAQTGQMQDLMSKAKDRGNYIGFLSWDEVQ